MKRCFVNQKGNSNKFWNIEIDDQTQIVTFGKINTKGRKSVKVFNSSEECKTKSEKLIASKIKKGYIEIKTKNNILEKSILTEEEVGKLFFWNSIERSNKVGNSDWKKYSVEEHLTNLVDLLSKHHKEKLIQFEKNLQEKLHSLYTAEIAELYLILWGLFDEKDGKVFFDDYISTDGFIYFRCWLLLKGKDFFDEITKDLNVFINGEYSFNIDDSWAEELLSASDDSYSVYNANEDGFAIRDAVSEIYPNVVHYDFGEEKLDKKPKSGYEIQKVYPELVDEIIYLRKNPT